MTRSNRGFTAIEIMMVILVLTILAGILLSGYRVLQQSASTVDTVHLLDAGLRETIDELGDRRSRNVTSLGATDALATAELASSLSSRLPDDTVVATPDTVVLTEDESLGVWVDVSDNLVYLSALSAQGCATIRWSPSLNTAAAGAWYSWRDAATTDCGHPNPLPAYTWFATMAEASA